MAVVFPASPQHRRKLSLVGALGITQILAWGTTFYLPAVLARPISEGTGWSLALVVAGLSWGLLVAGFCSPRIGRIIDRRGGRLVLTLGSAMVALGLFLLGQAESPGWYFAAWTVIGAGMAASLYDAAFALLGRLYGASARSAITGLTLLGGFASTLCWPAIAGLEQMLGWRDTCLVLALIQLVISLPVHFFLIPAQDRKSGGPDRKDARGRNTQKPALSLFADRQFLAICSALTLLAFVMSAVSVHLLDILQRIGLDAATAIAIGMVIGPAQVAARLLELATSGRLHPIWSARCGALLCFLGVLLFSGAGLHLAFIAAAIYGAGNGILTIAKGTLPLAIFGAQAYGERMGLLARPMLFAQASAPILAALAIQALGAVAALLMLSVLLLGGLLLFTSIQPPKPAATPC